MRLSIARSGQYEPCSTRPLRRPRPPRRSESTSSPRPQRATPSVGGSQTAAKGQVDHDVREPGKRADEPERRQDARGREAEHEERRRWVMHHVEEWHGAGRHLPTGMRLADTEQGREVGNDPEQEEHAYSEAVLARQRIGIEGDGETGDEPEMSTGKPPSGRRRRLRCICDASETDSIN